MSPEQVIEAVIQYADGIFEEDEIRGWLEQPGESVSQLPKDLQFCVWCIELKNTARDVMRSFPDWITVPDFLDYWNDLTIAERISLLATDLDDAFVCGCGCGE